MWLLMSREHVSHKDHLLYMQTDINPSGQEQESLGVFLWVINA